MNEYSCKSNDCWHYGSCRFTDKNWEELLIKHPPEINEETRKPKCFLEQNWFSVNKKKAMTLDELTDAKKARKREKKREK